MRYVFRVLSSEIKKSYKQSASGMGYYTIPVVNNENTYYKNFYVAIPEYKTFTKKDNLYFVLDKDNTTYDLKFIAENVSPRNINNGELLDVLCDDYMHYIINKNYSHKLPHAINNLMPVGISYFNENTNDYDLNKWSDTVSKISKSYPVELMAINPLTNNFIYPIEFKKFLDDKFVREYRGNVIMFTLSYDIRYQFTKNHDNYIYYCHNGEFLPIYQLIDEEKFFSECSRKDGINNVKTPFLKSFNDHGLAKELITYLNEDEGYQERIKNTYALLKEELELKEKDSKLYFISCSQNKKILAIGYNLKNKLPVSEDERNLYIQENERLLNKCVQLYDQDKTFYFSSDDLELIDNHFRINSALKEFVDKNHDELYYDREMKIIYGISTSNGKEIRTPLLKVIGNDELKKLKDAVYNRWHSNKQTQFKR